MNRIGAWKQQESQKNGWMCACYSCFPAKTRAGTFGGLMCPVFFVTSSTTSSNKKLLEKIASLLVPSALLVVTSSFAPPFEDEGTITPLHDHLSPQDVNDTNGTNDSNDSNLTALVDPESPPIMVSRQSLDGKNNPRERKKEDVEDLSLNVPRLSWINYLNVETTRIVPGRPWQVDSTPLSRIGDCVLWWALKDFILNFFLVGFS